MKLAIFCKFQNGPKKNITNHNNISHYSDKPRFHNKEHMTKADVNLGCGHSQVKMASWFNRLIGS
jgi:hypothetical protein